MANESHTTNNSQEQSQAALGKHGAARRRLAKAGVGAAGILWTLESKATWNTATCAAPSGSLSGDLSGAGRRNATACQGWTPAMWCQLSHFWPCSDKVSFTSVFPCRGSNKLTYGRVSMLDLLKGKNFDAYGLGAELVTAYLNVLTGRIGYLDEERVIDMWVQIQKGGYRAAPNVIWNARELAAYLKKTHY